MYRSYFIFHFCNASCANRWNAKDNFKSDFNEYIVFLKYFNCVSAATALLKKRYNIALASTSTYSSVFFSKIHNFPKLIQSDKFICIQWSLGDSAALTHKCVNYEILPVVQNYNKFSGFEGELIVFGCFEVVERAHFSDLLPSAAVSVGWWVSGQGQRSRFCLLLLFL